ncbi:hypothetical protein NDU88_002439 [Pleurodeles waltl]|uniref:Uncharacterized protein n=1 Tax=Pleurodeles waltl TaxID=8319 RepID=A0AAV7P6Y4_PLEWA|nr:hypothetical protein NDU88_002439 [Pleurodeles waltl]
MSTGGASMQELDKSDKLESAASSEGINPDLRVDGRGVSQYSFSVRSVERQEEWTKDALVIPLKEAGFVQWRHPSYNGELREFDNLNMEVGGRLSKFKYLQMKTWVGNVTEEVGSTNRLVDQMQADTPMKKEVARWYWLMMDIEDGEFNLPEEICMECLPEPQLKDLWQVSTTLLYNSVKPAAAVRSVVLHQLTIYMFIDCPLLCKFWQEVGDLIKEILPTSPKVRSLIVMFGCSYEVQKMGRDGAKLLFYMMLVARREIRRKWISPIPPTFVEWKNALIYHLELDCRKVC